MKLQYLTILLIVSSASSIADLNGLLMSAKGLPEAAAPAWQSASGTAQKYWKDLRRLYGTGAGPSVGSGVGTGSASNANLGNLGTLGGLAKLYGATQGGSRNNAMNLGVDTAKMGAGAARNLLSQFSGSGQGQAAAPSAAYLQALAGRAGALAGGQTQSQKLGSAGKPLSLSPKVVIHLPSASHGGESIHFGQQSAFGLDKKTVDSATEHFIGLTQTIQRLIERSAVRAKQEEIRRAQREKEKEARAQLEKFTKGVSGEILRKMGLHHKSAPTLPNVMVPVSVSPMPAQAAPLMTQPIIPAAASPVVAPTVLSPVATNPVVAHAPPATVVSLAAAAPATSLTATPAVATVPYQQPVHAAQPLTTFVPGAPVAQMPMETASPHQGIVMGMPIDRNAIYPGSHIIQGRPPSNPATPGTRFQLIHPSGELPPSTWNGLGYPLTGSTVPLTPDDI